MMCPPSLKLPTEPTWGIAVHDHYGPALGLWILDDLGFLTHRNSERWDAINVADFIPLTPEQVARLEAAQ